MKTAIIGAGNMGGAIARGLAKGTIIPAGNIIVSNPTQGKLDKLKAEFPALKVTNDYQEAAAGADMIIFAVKPWLMEPVIKELELKGTEILISVAAGIPFEKLTREHDNITLVRLNLDQAVIPESLGNRAIGINADMAESISDILNVSVSHPYPVQEQ